MKVLVIGGGGREHAVCRKLSESKDVTELLCAPGNAGIARVARCIPDVKATDIDGIVALAKREKVDFVCVTPDDPLALGCVDRLEAEGIAAFGPTAYAAQMEASKIFSKNLMRKYGIPTAKCRQGGRPGAGQGRRRRGDDRRSETGRDRDDAGRQVRQERRAGAD